MFEFCLEHSPFHLLLMAGNALVHFEECEHQGIAQEEVRFKEPERIDSKILCWVPFCQGKSRIGQPASESRPAIGYQTQILRDGHSDSECSCSLFRTDDRGEPASPQATGAQYAFK